jgi:hypothetical protein
MGITINTTGDVFVTTSESEQQSLVVGIRPGEELQPYKWIMLHHSDQTQTALDRLQDTHKLTRVDITFTDISGGE